MSDHFPSYSSRQIKAIAWLAWKHLDEQMPRSDDQMWTREQCEEFLKKEKQTIDPSAALKAFNERGLKQKIKTSFVGFCSAKLFKAKTQRESLLNALHPVNLNPNSNDLWIHNIGKPLHGAKPSSPDKKPGRTF